MTKGPGMSMSVRVCVYVWGLLVFYGADAGGIMLRICQKIIRPI